MAAGVALALIDIANGSPGDLTDDVGTWCDARGPEVEVEGVECGAFAAVVVVVVDSPVQHGDEPSGWADISIA